MDKSDESIVPDYSDLSPGDQLERAARDLWSQIVEKGEDYVLFLDRRRLATRVRYESDGMYGVSWQQDDESWTPFSRRFDNPREAAFHAYQGPH